MYDINYFLKIEKRYKSFYIYPPTINEYLKLDFLKLGIKILTITQEDIEDEMAENDISFDNILTPMEYCMNLAYNLKEIDEAIKKTLNFLTREEIEIDYGEKAILIGATTITEQEYLGFQNEIRLCMSENPVSPPDPNMHPKLKEMKAKARYRDRIKVKKGMGIGFQDLITSICCMGIGITPLNIGELSYAAIKPLTDRYQSKEKYSCDIKQLLAGADEKKVKPKYWMEKIENN